MTVLRHAMGLALLLAACGAVPPIGVQVPLHTVDSDVDPLGGICALTFRVVDVVADAEFGTVDKRTDEPLTWATGYTGWQVGTEVEVRDPTGKAVLVTGSRYRLIPSDYGPRPVICMVDPCPDCELGGGPL